MDIKNISPQRKAEVVLVFPPGGDFPFPAFTPCLGNAYIAAYLIERGVTVALFSSETALTAQETVNQILCMEPRIIGFTVFNTNYVSCSLLAKKVKEICPDITVIFGGPMATVLSTEILKENPYVDICVRGEGEEVLYSLAEKIFNSGSSFSEIDGKLLSTISGLTYRLGNNIHSTINSCALKDLIKKYSNLDKYPSPYLSGVLSPMLAPTLGIITARGCNQNCTYCNCAVLSNRRIFPHSIERVIEELKIISSLNEFKRPVPIQDDAFTLIPGRAETICKKIIDNQIHIPLSALVRCDQVTENLLELMRTAGFQSIGFSLESSSPKILRNIGKVRPPKTTKDPTFLREKGYIEALRNNVSYAKRLGFKPVFVSVMVGLPGESLSEARETIAFVQSLNADMYMHNLFTIYPGTPISENPQSFGYRVEYLGKSKLFPTTKHPFDVRRGVPFAPSSNYQRSGTFNDLSTARRIGFATQSKQQLGFNSVFIINDELTSSIVNWLQSNLVINGYIIQLYSSEKALKKDHRSAVINLNESLSPSLNYEPYSISNDEKKQFLVSNRIIESGNKDLGVPIQLINTASWHRGKLGQCRGESTICIEKEEDDVVALMEFFDSLHYNQRPVSTLSNSPFLPYFQGLCRWLPNGANCMVGDMAIIGPSEEIRLCWHGTPVGNLSNSYSEIIQKSLEIHNQEKIRRDCYSCPIETNCISCTFPHPISPDTYCNLRKSFNLNPSAFAIRAFDELKMTLRRF